MMSPLAIQLILFGGWLPKRSPQPTSLADLDLPPETSEGKTETQLELPLQED